MDARLSNSSVTSSAIKMRGSQITYSWNNIIADNVVPSKFDTTSEAQTELQFMGWQNPNYTVEGVIDESSSAVANSMTLSLLKEFAQSTGSTYLYDDVLCSSGAKVAIKSFKIPKSAAQRNLVYRYTLELVETK